MLTPSQMHPEGGTMPEGSTTQAQMGGLGKTQPAGGNVPHHEKKSGFEKVKEKLHMK